VLTDTGSTPLVVTGVSVAGANAGDFAIVSESCLASPVLPGETCRVGLQFTPKAAWARSATLTVADNTAAGTTTAALTGSGPGPATVPSERTPDGAVPTSQSPGTGGTGGAGQATGAGQTTGASSRSQRANGPVPRASCTVKTTTRRHDRSRSTVTCRMTWPATGAVALRARLMHGSAVLVRTRTTARAGHAALRLRTARRLRPGHYAVVIARPDGTVVLRNEIRVS
jgi:hypothetical protein